MADILDLIRAYLNARQGGGLLPSGELPVRRQGMSGGPPLQEPPSNAMTADQLQSLLNPSSLPPMFSPPAAGTPQPQVDWGQSTHRGVTASFPYDNGRPRRLAQGPGYWENMLRGLFDLYGQGQQNGG